MDNGGNRFAKITSQPSKTPPKHGRPDPGEEDTPKSKRQRRDESPSSEIGYTNNSRGNVPNSGIVQVEPISRDLIINTQLDSGSSQQPQAGTFYRSLRGNLHAAMQRLKEISEARPRIEIGSDEAYDLVDLVLFLKIIRFSNSHFEAAGEKAAEGLKSLEEGLKNVQDAISLLGLALATIK